jgi:hypothetical protein
MKFLWNILDPTTGNVTQFVRYCPISAFDGVKNQVRGISTTFDTEDTLTNTLKGEFATDIQTATVSTFVTQNFDHSTLPTLFGTLNLYYENGLQNVVDTINTFDAAPSANSLWVAPPSITVTSTGTPLVYTITINGLLDLTLAPFSISNVILYSSYNSLSNGDLVTDSGVNITDDTGTNITTD